MEIIFTKSGDRFIKKFMEFCLEGRAKNLKNIDKE